MGWWKTLLSYFKVFQRFIGISLHILSPFNVFKFLSWMIQEQLLNSIVSLQLFSAVISNPAWGGVAITGQQELYEIQQGQAKHHAPGRKKLSQQDRLGNSSVEEVLGGLVGSKLRTDQQWALASWKPTVPWVVCQQDHIQQIKESDCSLYSATVRPRLEHCDQFGMLRYGKGTDKLEWVQGRVTRMVRDGECALWWQAEGLGLVYLEREYLWGSHTKSPSTVRSLSKRWIHAFSVVLVWRLWGNGHKVKPWRFRLDTRNVLPTKQWSQVAQRGCGVSAPGSFEAHTLGTAQSNLVWPCSWPCCEHGVGLEASWGPFQSELARNPICVREELIYATA